MATASHVATPAARILIADDHSDVAGALRLLLKADGYMTHSVSSPQAALDALEHASYDLLLLDLNYSRDTTSGREGVELVSMIRRHDRSLPIVAMTAWGTVDVAVEIMRTGVNDFLQKPWNNARLLDMVATRIAEGRARRVRDARSVVDRGLEHEREAAGDVQRTLLPRSLPPVPGLDLAVVWNPAGDVGGDLYEVMDLGSGHLALSIGDASGKGVSAAIIMASVQALVRAVAPATVSPAALCSTINTALCPRLAEGRFVTLFHALIDVNRGVLTYCNAGHTFPILVRKNGSVERLRRGGPILGIIPAAKYEAVEIDFREGDRLVLFTDGLPELSDSEGRECGDDRLVALTSRPLASAQTVVDDTMTALRDFSPSGFQDDVTLMVCDKK